MSILLSVLFAIIFFSILIFVHELGHFIAAKLSGVQVNEFAMFMGPALVKWKRGETLYSVRTIPIGGYCAMEGEDADTDNPKSFQKAAWWKRLIILVAGSFMNFVTGVLVIAIILAFQPAYATTEIAEIADWSAVSEGTGLQVGDKILEFNGEKMHIYEDFSLATVMLPNGEYDIVVDRNGEKVLLQDVSMVRKPVDDGNGGEILLYGITFSTTETTPASIPGRILPTAFNYVKSVFLSLRMLFTGQAGLQDMTGPVGIVQMMSESAAAAESTGGAILNMLYFGGFLAINLAVMNMLPIPALDGGRVLALLLVTAIEAITRRKINPKYEGYIHAAGMILLLGFMAIVMFKDIFTIFKG